jgi:hypothetical protein
MHNTICSVAGWITGRSFDHGQARKTSAEFWDNTGAIHHVIERPPPDRRAVRYARFAATMSSMATPMAL